MASRWESHLARWVEAGLMDSTTAERIREFESREAPTPRLRWPIVLALAFGGLLLGAGVLLFVAAHWDNLSPARRMTLITAMVAVFHGAAVFFTNRFPGLASTFHAVGTITLGGAIFMAGQIFHLAEHWPTGVLLWAIGAATGVVLFKDWPHVTMAALLIPAWVLSQWGESTEWNRNDLLAAFPLLLAFTYISALYPNHNSAWRRALAVIGSIALLPCVLLAAIVRKSGAIIPTLFPWQGMVAFLLPLMLALVLRGNLASMNAIAAVWVGILLALTDAKLELAQYVWCAAGSIGLIAWGLRELRPERVNLGVAGFAITVLFFYFSKVLETLDRSLSLILLGAIFLLGGWQMERLRRRLIAQIKPA